MKKQANYNLYTAITMIVGICVGSGIFFKADDILRQTGGNVALGVLVLSLGALGIIFGSLTMTELSIRTEKNGGLVGYFEDFVSPQVASGFGWFQTFLYYPTINVVVAWAAGIYTSQFIGLTKCLETEILLGAGYLLFFYCVNYFSAKAGGHFQVLSTFLKLIPLIGIGILGFFWKNSHAQETAQAVAAGPTFRGGWLAALAPAAFSYDGWPIATSVTNEVENPKRNMPLALMIAPVIVLIVYVLYFVGLTTILGADQVLLLGDEGIYTIGKRLFGPSGGKLITFFVIISVLGVINGVSLGNIRMPHALATKKMLPFANQLSQTKKEGTVNLSSFLISLAVTFFWLVIHYLSQKFKWFTQGDVSEIAIVFGYLCYPVLYLQVIKMYRQGIIKSSFKGLLTPLLAIVGSGIVVIGGFLSNPVNVLFFVLVCFLLTLVGYKYYQKKA